MSVSKPIATDARRCRRDLRPGLCQIASIWEPRNHPEVIRVNTISKTESYELEWKSNDFACYILQLPEQFMISLHTFNTSRFGVSETRTPYRGSKIEWPFRRENSRVRSRILDKSIGSSQEDIFTCTPTHHTLLEAIALDGSHAFFQQPFKHARSTLNGSR